MSVPLCKQECDDGGCDDVEGTRQEYGLGRDTVEHLGRVEEYPLLCTTLRRRETLVSTEAVAQRRFTYVVQALAVYFVGYGRRRLESCLWVCGENQPCPTSFVRMPNHSRFD